MAKFNIFFGLSRIDGENYVKYVANKANCYMLSVPALVEYELDEGNVSSNVNGLEYVDNLIDKTVIDVLKYQKSIAWIDYELLTRKAVLKEFKGKVNLIFLDFSKSMVDSVTSQIAFDERREFCKKIANEIVHVDKEYDAEIVEKIAEKLLV